MEKSHESPLDSKEINPEYSLEGLMELQYFGHLMWRRKDSDAGKDWRQKEKGVAEDKMVDGISNSMDMNLSKLQEIVEDRWGWHASVHGVAKK